MKALTEIALFFPRLTYTNVLMDRGDKDNEEEERGTEEQRRGKDSAPHIHTDEAGKFSREAEFAGMEPTLVGRERALKVTYE